MNEIKGRLLIVKEPITSAMIFGDTDKQLFGGCDGSREKLQTAEIIVSTAQFGYGKSSDANVAVLRASSIKAIVARDFGREFFRKAINAGLPLFTAELPETINDNINITISLTDGTISFGDETVRTQKYPQFLRECFEVGSQVAVTRQMLGKD